MSGVKIHSFSEGDAADVKKPDPIHDLIEARPMPMMPVADSLMEAILPYSAPLHGAPYLPAPRPLGPPVASYTGAIAAVTTMLQGLGTDDRLPRIPRMPLRDELAVEIYLLGKTIDDYIGQMNATLALLEK